MLHWKGQNAAQHILGLFGWVCTILYGCHAQFYMGEQSELGEWLWMTCSLSVYPLYYLYILRLTTDMTRFPWWSISLLIPALILPTAEYFFPSINMYHVREVSMAAIVLFVCCSGLTILNRFEHEIHEFYADTEGKSSCSIRLLLVLFAICSVCSVIVSSIGRKFFQERLILAIPSIVFSLLLFAVFYLGERYTFTAEEMQKDGRTEDSCPTDVAEDEHQQWISELERLMTEDRVYLEPNLKIADLAARVGTCRTYISNHINQQKGMSFSDYINEQRIRYAEQLKKEDPTLSNEYLAAATGFASEQSYVRNYRKFSKQKQ